jgi:hypothetical protein
MQFIQNTHCFISNAKFDKKGKLCIINLTTTQSDTIGNRHDFLFYGGAYLQ